MRTPICLRNALLLSILYGVGLPRATTSQDLESMEAALSLEEMGARATSLTFLPDSRTALLVSNDEQRLFLLDTHAARIVERLDFPGELTERATLSDVAIDPGSRYAFLVGVLSSGRGLLLRLDLESLELRVVEFWDEFREPSVAVSAEHAVFIGDLNSSTITVFEDYVLEDRAGKPLYRSDLGQNIYLRRGPAVDLGVSHDGRFIIVSHAGDTVLSLVDFAVAEVVDEFGPGGRRYPFPMVVAHPHLSGKSPGPATAVVVAELDEDVLVTAYLDRDFQRFRQVELARLDLRATSDDQRLRSPLLVSASDDLDLIVVGSRHDARALFRSPLVARVVRLERGFDDIDVSPDGSMVAILDAQDARLTLIRNPDVWAFQSGSAPGSDRVREAQRLLSDLRFPVGQVDGVDGPSTRRAVSIFQESDGLAVTGRLDATTLERIRAVAGERAVATSDSVEIVGSGRQCAPLPPEARCSARFGAGRISSSYGGPLTEEVICAAPEGSDSPVQIDTHKLTKLESEYQCTSFHSCAFIRFRELFAYHNICAFRAAEPSKR